MTPALTPRQFWRRMVHLNLRFPLDVAEVPQPAGLSGKNGNKWGLLSYRWKKTNEIPNLSNY